MLEVELWRERSEIEIEIEIEIDIEIHDMLEVELWSCRVPFTQMHRSVHRGIGLFTQRRRRRTLAVTLTAMPTLGLNAHCDAHCCCLLPPSAAHRCH
jgi:hypothetical protein